MMISALDLSHTPLDARSKLTIELALELVFETEPGGVVGSSKVGLRLDMADAEDSLLHLQKRSNEDFLPEIILDWTALG